MYVIYKGKRYVAFSPLPGPDVTGQLKSRSTTGSVATAATAANGCQKVRGGTGSIAMILAEERPPTGGKNGKTFQSNLSEKG